MYDKNNYSMVWKDHPSHNSGEKVPHVPGSQHSKTSESNWDFWIRKTTNKNVASHESCVCLSASSHELTCAALPCMFCCAVCTNVPICPAMIQHRNAFEHGWLCVPSAYIRVVLELLSGYMLVCVCGEAEMCPEAGLSLQYKGHASRGDRTLINYVAKTDNVRVLLSPPHYLHWLNLAPLPPTPSFPICGALNLLLNVPWSFLISTWPFILCFAHLRHLRLSSPPLLIKKKVISRSQFFPHTKCIFATH